MKDQSKLFRDISEDVYENNFHLLVRMRVLHPVYRDDQLLMKMLCETDVSLRVLEKELAVVVESLEISKEAIYNRLGGRP